MFSVIGASFWKFVAIQQAIGMRLSFAKFLMDLRGVKCWAITPSTRHRPRNCVCSMAWSFHAIDATSSPYLRQLDDGVEVTKVSAIILRIT